MNLISKTALLETHIKKASDVALAFFILALRGGAVFALWAAPQESKQDRDNGAIEAPPLR